MNKETRERKYERLKKLTGWQYPERLDMIILGLNLGINIMAVNTLLQRSHLYDKEKSCKDNLIAVYGKDACQLVEELMKPAT